MSNFVMFGRLKFTVIAEVCLLGLNRFFNWTFATRAHNILVVGWASLLQMVSLKILLFTILFHIGCYFQYLM